MLIAIVKVALPENVVSGGSLFLSPFSEELSPSISETLESRGIEICAPTVDSFVVTVANLSFFRLLNFFLLLHHHPSKKQHFWSTYMILNRGHTPGVSATINELNGPKGQEPDSNARLQQVIKNSNY